MDEFYSHNGPLPQPCRRLTRSKCLIVENNGKYIDRLGNVVTIVDDCKLIDNRVLFLGDNGVLYSQSGICSKGDMNDGCRCLLRAYREEIDGIVDYTIFTPKTASRKALNGKSSYMFKIEVGGTYKDRSGDIVRIIKRDDEDHPVVNFIGDNGKTYYSNGQRSLSMTTDRDLIEVVTSSILNDLHDYAKVKDFDVDLNILLLDSKMTEILRLLRKADDLSKDLKIKFTASFG